MFVIFSVQVLVVCVILLLAKLLLPIVLIWNKENRIPGKSQFLLIKDLISYSDDPRSTFYILKELFLTYGKTYRVRILFNLYVFLADPDDAEIVLTQSKLITRDRNMMNAMANFVGDSIITSTGEKWRERRKMFTPSFHFKILEKFIPAFHEKANILCDHLRKYSDGKELEIYDLIGCTTLDMICDTAMGVNVDTISGKHCEFVNAMEYYLMFIHDLSIKPWLKLIVKLPFSQKAKQLAYTKKALQGFAKSVIAKKISECNRLKLNDTNHVPASTEEPLRKEKRVAFLDLLIQTAAAEGQVLSDAELQHEVYAMMNAGQDTTATTSCYVLTILGIMPEIQEKVLEELKEIFGDDRERSVTLEDLSNMRCLERVIKETMRLFPPVPIFPRAVDEDVQLPSALVPAGSSAVINAYFLHRDQRYFPNPEEFDPDRFLPENCVDRHPFCYLPFSAGSRNCIGARYAMLQMKTLLSTVLRRYRFLPHGTMDDLRKVKVGLILKPVGGFHVRLVPREDFASA